MLACSVLVWMVGSTSNLVALLPPEARTMRWKLVLSSLSSGAFCGSVPLLNCGSLTLSNSSLADEVRKVVDTWVQIALKRFRTLVRSPGMLLIHCHES